MSDFKTANGVVYNMATLEPEYIMKQFESRLARNNLNVYDKMRFAEEQIKKWMEYQNNLSE